MDKDFARLRAECTTKMLELYKVANAGHIGASLSCLEILLYALHGEMRREDQIVLSKGHAAGALYVALASADRLNGVPLESFYKDDTLLAAHPPCGGSIPSIPFGTGSLGHGLSLAVGMTFSQRFTKKSFRTFVVLSEGDCNEGSTWEAAMFAGHHRLENLVVVIDLNGLQGIGNSRDILNLDPIANKWREFGFATLVCEEGNSFPELAKSFRAAKENHGKPICIVAKTVKGHGVSFMENEMKWHYLPMSDAQYAQALAETEKLNA